jgi:D-inositol-3-phosphate glycosyltransferase
MVIRESGGLKVLMANAFYPRGGSGQVVRYLARALTARGHNVLILAGSLKGSDPTCDAAKFYDGLALVEVDYTKAARGFAAGLNPMSSCFDVPFQPSYEDKPGAPDRVFYRVNRAEMRHLIACWRDVLSKTTRQFQPDIAHLHHLNHVHMAASGLASMRCLPKLAHLHGTELKMLQEMNHLTVSGHGETRLWDEALRKAAAGMQHFVAISPDNLERSKQVLALEADNLSVIPNGVDLELFRPRNWSRQRRMSLLEKLLVTSPRGWDESSGVGSIQYARNHLETFVDDLDEFKPVLMFAGRFLRFKRLPLLLSSIAHANRFFREKGHAIPPFNLLLCGGVPGEWEGEHPYTTARRLGLSNVFFSGWLPHQELAEVLSIADVFVAPSENEPFGLVFLEAMASGAPVIAGRSGGPLSFVVADGDKANGWFCEEDDPVSLTRVIIESVSNQVERRRRGRNARATVVTNYGWSRIAERFEEVYQRMACP